MTIESGTRIVSGKASLVDITSPKAITTDEKQQHLSSPGLVEFPQYIPTPIPVWQFKALELLIGMICCFAPLLVMACIVLTAGPQQRPSINPLDISTLVAIKSTMGTAAVIQMLQRYTFHRFVLIYELGSVNLPDILALPNLDQIIAVRPAHMTPQNFGEIVKVLATMKKTSIII